MLNQTVIVGRVVDDPKVTKTDSGKNVSNITIAVPRSFKNAEGVYDTDFVDCVLWDSVAQNTAEFCHKGDVVGVKGRVQTELYDKEGETRKSTRIIAERVTFLSSNKEKVDEKIAANNKEKVKEKNKDIDR